MARKNDEYAQMQLLKGISESEALTGPMSPPKAFMKLVQLYGVNPQFKEAVDIVLASVFSAIPPEEDAENCSDPHCRAHSGDGLEITRIGASELPEELVKMLDQVAEQIKASRGK